MAEFDGKAGLITGGAAGIGRTTALAFAKEGAKVAIITAHSIKAAEETVSDIKNMGREAIFVQCDIANGKQVEAMVAKVVATFGKLDFAFNNAGIDHPAKRTHEVTEEMWEKVISTNLKGTWLCMKYELGQMLKQGHGAIVNCSSAGGLGAAPFLTAYAASKGGINQLTRTAAAEYARDGIRVNAVCPSITMTPLTEAFLKNAPEEAQRIIDKAPIGRIAQPEEIASAVLWLCSKGASFTTGVCLPIDGGMTA